MKSPLKPLAAQVVVLTGATSGIGLATARRLSAEGAALVLVARNEAALRALADELKAKGRRAEFVVADVGDEAQLRHAAQKADAAFGGFDTWINDAGVSIFGTIENTPLEDQRKLFDTNYWGVVHGSKIAAEHLKARKGGGAIINVGSVLGDFPIPIQGVYSASKHAVKGFTNALRMELLRDTPEIQITLIKPSAIDTPYKEHARNYTDAPGTNPPPVYATPLVAEAIAYACTHRVRELTVGGGGRLQAWLGQYASWLSEPLTAVLLPRLLKDKPANHPREHDSLHEPGRDLRERAPYPMVRETSLWSEAQMNPRRTGGVIAAVAVGLLLAHALRDSLRVRRIRREERDRWLEKV